MGRARALVGLILVGYGLLILSGVLAHESMLAGFVSLGLGFVIARTSLPPLQLRRGKLIAGLGASIVIAVLAYNLVRGSAISLPEGAIVAYGGALVASAPFLSRTLGRVDVGTLVAWSFPLVLAPLTVFALNAALSTPNSGAAAAPYVIVLIVWPTVWALKVLGTPSRLVDDSVIMETDRGLLVVDIGLVCAGLYPMVLFGGIVALHAWRVRLAPKDVAKILVAGILGLWFVNLLRLVALARVGVEWGPRALTEAHANLGWLLFGAFMLVFCLVFLREPGRVHVAANASSSHAVPAPRAGTAGSWWRIFPKRP